MIYPIRGTINERPDQDDNEFYSRAILGNLNCSEDEVRIEIQISLCSFDLSGFIYINEIKYIFVQIMPIEKRFHISLQI